MPRTRRLRSLSSRLHLDPAHSATSWIVRQNVDALCVTQCQCTHDATFGELGEDMIFAGKGDQILVVEGWFQIYLLRTIELAA